MLAEWMSWMADVCLRILGQTSAHHMPAAPQGTSAHPIPEAFEDSQGSEGNTCRDGMPVSHRSECSSETAWDYLENASRSTHTHHSSGELRIEVYSRRHAHTCLNPDSFVLAYVNTSHQGLVAVVERQSLSPKSLPLLQFRFLADYLYAPDGEKSLTSMV